MKKKIIVAVFIFSMLVGSIDGQGTFVYDQQSADEGSLKEGGANVYDSQSFTPAFSAVGFVRLYVYDGFPGSNSTTISVNLRADSITGAILASTVPVTLSDGFSGPVNFFFGNPGPVAPGTTYYFEGQIQSGGGFGLNASSYNYPGGTVFSGGAALPNLDLWFREGVVVPEPSVATLFLFGGVGLAAVCYQRKARDAAC